MTRWPDADEALILGERSGWKGGERFYLRDLALFLHQSVPSVRKWAKGQGLLKGQSMKARGLPSRIEYLTRYGALRAIAHFRAMQGEEYLAGRDYHRAKDTQRRQYARKRMRQGKSLPRCR